MVTSNKNKVTAENQTADYKHAQEATQRPDVGLQDQFTTKRLPKTYRYDSSLDPALSWDENRDRGLSEWLIGLVQRCAMEGEASVFAHAQRWAGGGVQVQSLKAVADLLQTLSQPFLNWTGKAERHQITVPTMPLFVHERHSTKAILEGIKSRKAKGTNLDMFGDGGLDVTDKLDAYEHKGPWQNRLVLGDSLQIMNSLLEFEGLGGQVQMVYMDPPYGVKFGSNFQPFVRDRDMGGKHGHDNFMTREPEMVKAYRDTWELGLHSYLTYLRDRLTLTKELLHESGTVFVQISDENMHHVREVLDEVFGSANFSGVISFFKTSSQGSAKIQSIVDFILVYAKDIGRQKYRPLLMPKTLGGKGAKQYVVTISPNMKDMRRMSPEEIADPTLLPAGWRVCRLGPTTSQGAQEGRSGPYLFEGVTFYPSANRHWSYDLSAPIEF